MQLTNLLSEFSITDPALDTETCECVFDFGRAYQRAIYARGRCGNGHVITPGIASAGLARASANVLVTVHFLFGAFVNRSVSRTVAYHAIIEQQAAMIAAQGTLGCKDLAQKLRSNEKAISHLISLYHFSRDKNSDWRLSLTCACKELVAVCIDGTGSGVHTRCELAPVTPVDADRRRRRRRWARATVLSCFIINFV
jgi:hypothetical protein